MTDKLPIYKESLEKAAEYWNEEQKALQERKHAEEKLRFEKAKADLELQRVSTDSHSRLIREYDALREELATVEQMHANTYELAKDLKTERDNAEKALDGQWKRITGASAIIFVFIMLVSSVIFQQLHVQFIQEMGAISTEIQILKDNRVNLDKQFEEFKKLSKEFKDY